MPRPIRAAGCCVLGALLAACASTPPAPPPPELAAPPSHQTTSPTPSPTPVPVRPTPRPAWHPHPASAPSATAEPAPAQALSPSRERMQQIDQRIDQLHHHIDAQVASGHIQTADADALHHRLDVIHQEADDMGAPHGNGLSADEQHVLGQELDTAAYAIDQ